MKTLLAAALVAAFSLLPPPAFASTSAESAIGEAREAIQANPKDPAGYNMLAIAYLRRQRESGDDAFIAKAAEAVEKSRQLAPADFEVGKTYATVLVAQHDYLKAIEIAVPLNKKTPDDVAMYGILTDAYTALGRYDAAEKSGQWMLDLRPGNTPAYIRAARLRELFGDNSGAYDVLDLAFQATSPTENEERAWILTQMAHMRLMDGKLDVAAKFCDRALAAFPHYWFTLATQAQIREAQNLYDEAIPLLKQVYETTRRPADLFQLAEAQQHAGHDEESRRAFADFESIALKQQSEKDNANTDLILYYAGPGRQPAKALDLAKREFAYRKDVFTLDAYAWALHVNGQDTEARKQVEAALAVGIKDPRLLFHAGEIALQLNDKAAAARYFKDAAELNTLGSAAARAALRELPVVTEPRP